jgi:hypothetical protein
LRLNVVASGLELRTNSGSNAIIKLAKARIKNAMRTFKNNFSYDLYADGTLPNQINGLQAWFLMQELALSVVLTLLCGRFGRARFSRLQLRSRAVVLSPQAQRRLKRALMLPLWLEPGPWRRHAGFDRFFERLLHVLRRLAGCYQALYARW